jgi:hypothetical protein
MRAMSETVKPNERAVVTLQKARNHRRVKVEGNRWTVHRHHPVSTTQESPLLFSLLTEIAKLHKHLRADNGKRSYSSA